MKHLLAAPLVFISLQALATTSESIILARQGCRHEIMALSDRPKIFSPIKDGDYAEDLVENPQSMVRSLKEMDRLKLQQGEAVTIPWSDSYWPIYKGGIAERYSDEKFMELDWFEGKNYVDQHPISELLSEGRINDLSPSEKYDLFFQSKGQPLTSAAWEKGKLYYDRSGNVESWMGHCHGWSAASIMMPEPVKNVEMSFSGIKGVFHPSDIKALATLLWAQGNYASKFIGGRCNTRTPSPRSERCLDTNPGTWHLAAVNQLGISRRPFVMDANFDYEVWNQPVFKYEYTYFNPKTGNVFKTYEEAVLKRGSFEDSNEKFRAEKTKFIVGVSMQVSYVIENTPSAGENQEIETSSTGYDYDLELDENHQIIGGEWHSYQHPDFLWVPVKGTFPATLGDGPDGGSDFHNITPEMRSVVQANSERNLPWGPFVRNLFSQSARKN